MRMKKIKSLAIVMSLVSVAGMFAACGGSTEEVKDSGTGKESASLSGEIKVDGSSTVAPITEAMAEEFNIENRDVKIPVGVSGTGGGFKRFVVGETDIQDASRTIKDSEIERRLQIM